jgi:hypothetical protein
MAKKAKATPLGVSAWWHGFIKEFLKQDPEYIAAAITKGVSETKAYAIAAALLAERANIMVAKSEPTPKTGEEVLRLLGIEDHKEEA